MNNKKSPIFIVIIVALAFGILGGISGEIMARIYLFEDLYKVPLLGEIDVPENVYGGSNLIIESPRKVVVEQNTKVLEVVNSASKNIIGIYEKKQSANPSLLATSTIQVDQLYNKSEFLGQGFVVTSDGWLLSSYIPNKLIGLADLEATSSILKFKEEFTSQYAMIDSEGRIYDVLDVELDLESGISFWRIDVEDFGVRQFERISEIEKGQLVIATNYTGQTWLTTISKKMKEELPLLMSSDESYSELKLVQDVDEVFGNGFLFNTDGDLIAIIDYDESIIPVSSYFSCLNCLLDNQKIRKSKLGISYVDLSKLSDPLTRQRAGLGALVYPDENGVAVKADSPAQKVGIKEGDIITSVNTIKIDEKNNLSDLISEYAPGETISLNILRDGKELQILVELAAREEID